MQSTCSRTTQPYITLYYQPGARGLPERPGRPDFTPQPEPDGDLLATYGPFSFISIKPPTGATDRVPATSGASGTVWIVIALAVAAVIVIVVVLSRRKAGDEDEA